MKRIVFVLLALVLAAAGSAQAQNPTQARPSGPPPSGIGEVLGTVVDTADKAPVARASLTVRSKADSALVTGGYTTPDGAFRLQGLPRPSGSSRATIRSTSPRRRHARTSVPSR